jgi:hypothetical protein
MNLNDLNISKFNPFQEDSFMHPFRWFLLIVALLGSLLFYTDRRGSRLFSGSGQQQWSASGPRGYHK